MNAVRPRAYLVDDEPLAIERLMRLLDKTGAVDIAGSASDPQTAIAFLNGPEGVTIDALFLDIEMPGMNGFELLSRLSEQPYVIFTTAYDHYALRAFEVNSIDYLVKPIEAESLDRALQKLARLRPKEKQEWQRTPELHSLLQELATSLRGEKPSYPRRLATRIGERITFLDVESITHFIAQDKLTYAVVNGKQHCIDQTITELESRLDPERFQRIHRAVLVNMDWIQELNAWFGGKIVVTLKDAQRTQLTVARDRVRALKTRLGLPG